MSHGNALYATTTQQLKMQPEDRPLLAFCLHLTTFDYILCVKEN